MVHNMNKIIKILMERDNLSKEDACAEVKATLEEMQDAIAEGDSEQCEDILMDNLGLEPDYLPYFLGIF